jgi:hypothetical protein
MIPFEAEAEQLKRSSWPRCDQLAVQLGQHGKAAVPALELATSRSTTGRICQFWMATRTTLSSFSARAVYGSRLYVVNNYPEAIFVFRAAGDTRPIRTISGAKMGLQKAIGIAAH